MKTRRFDINYFNAKHDKNWDKKDSYISLTILLYYFGFDFWYAYWKDTRHPGRKMAFEVFDL